MSQLPEQGTCLDCGCLKTAHHGPRRGCEGAGGSCGCELTFPLGHNAAAVAQEPITGPFPNKGRQVPEQTISDECKYCAEGEPEWSPYAKCWIHRRASLDKRCTRKRLGPCGELPEELVQAQSEVREPAKFQETEELIERLHEGEETPEDRDEIAACLRARVESGGQTLPLCETTSTPRLPCALRCGTYPGNLGPCETWEEGGNGRCVYCDHGKQCHAGAQALLDERGARGLLVSAEQAREWSAKASTEGEYQYWLGYARGVEGQARARAGEGRSVASTEPQDWSVIIAEANCLRALLDSKPDELKCGTWVNPGSILNAYREGDLTFDQCVKQLDAWRASQPSPVSLEEGARKLRDAAVEFARKWLAVERDKEMLAVSDWIREAEAYGKHLPELIGRCAAAFASQQAQGKDKV